MSNNYGPRIVTDGLVLCLDAADQNSYSGSGNTWTDLSGNGNNGTISNAVFSNSNGGVFTFNSNNSSIISISDSTDFTMSVSLTINAWFLVSDFSTSAAGKGIFGSYDAPVREYYGLRVNGGDSTGFERQDVSYYYDTNDAIGFQRISSTTELSTNIWYYASMTWKAGDFHRGYLNGLLEVETNTGVSSNNLDPTTGFFIGYDGGSYGYLDGSISNVSIYNRALTNSEIRQNFEATKGRFGL
jgi:hypothetical protein